MAWELGSNLGHLSRLLPLGRRLLARGHKLLAVVRDLALAARILGPVGIPFIQAPRMSPTSGAATQPASYADVLRHTGWGDVQQLWGATQAWVNAIRLFIPDAIVVDHSPTALLAVRCTTDVPCILIGTGFELPPLRQPLPCFPGFPGATPENAARAEAQVLENANRVLDALRGRRMQALSDVFRCEHRWLTTFPELDHYDARPGERYVGEIGEVGQAERVDWPSDASHRVFAYLRPDTPDLDDVLHSLAECGAAVVCYGPGILPQQMAAVSRDRLRFTARPVELGTLLRDTNVCVSYSPAGTVTSTLLRGVPQLMAPSHVEAQLTAHRVECMGAGVTLRGTPGQQRITARLYDLLHNPFFKARATEFAARYRHHDLGSAADRIVDEVESLAGAC